MTVPGRAGLVRHGYHLYDQEETFFVQYPISNKSIDSEIPRCFKDPYDCGKNLSTVSSLCFDTRGSQ